MKVKLLRLELFPCYLLVVVGCGDISKRLDKLGIKYTDHEKEAEFENNPNDQAFALKLKKLHTPKNLNWHTGAVFMFWARGVPIRNRGMSTLAHEVNHLKNFIFKYMQQRLNVNNDEFESYTVGYLTEKILDVIRGKDPPRRKK